MMIAIDTDTETITVEGMSFSFDFFHCFAKPDPRDLYSFEEVGEVVVATLVSSGASDAE